MISTQKLSAGLRFLNLRDVRNIFGFVSDDEARKHLQWLGVPIWKYRRDCRLAGTQEERITTPVERVLAMSLEMALFAHLLPGGPGISDPSLRDSDPAEPMQVDNLPDGVHNVSEALRCPDYWLLFKEQPHALQLMVALAGQLYGPYEEGVIRRRLEALGDLLIRRTKGQKKKKKKDA